MKFLQSLFNKPDPQTRFDEHYNAIILIENSEARQRAIEVIMNPAEFQIQDDHTSPLVDRLGEFTATFFKKYPSIVPVESLLSLGQNQFEILELDGYPELIKIGMDNTATVACVPNSDTIYVIEEYVEDVREVLDYPYPTICHYIIEEYEDRHAG